MRLRAVAVISVLAVAAAGAALAASALWGGRDCYSGAVSYCINRPGPLGKLAYPEPTPYWRGTPGTRPDGLPVMVGPHGEHFHNMSSIAMAAFNRSTKPFEERCAEFQMTPIAAAALRYLKDNAKPVAGALVWHYDYATQLNDSVLQGGWPSAFSQSAIIQLLMLANCKTGDAAFADMARRAAAAFDIGVTDGGLRSENPALVWFQEVPLPDRHNPFIFNAHLYAVETLLLMHRLTGEERYQALAMRGVASIEKALPVIDTGNWNRYDLRPPYQMIICEPTAMRRGCKWRRSLFPQEFDPSNLAVAAGQTFSPAAVAPSARPVDGEMQTFAPGDLSRVHWGSTAENYIPWHADLLASIGEQVNRAEFVDASERWLRYHAAYRATIGEAR
jgi:hypothetical protein